MTTKKKIIISVTAAVLVIAVAVVGVLAAQSTTVGITNTVSFTATSVNAEVTVSATTAKTQSDGSVIACDGVSFSDTTSGFDASGKATYTFADTATQTKTAVFNDIALTAASDAVVYTITFKNNGEAFKITATGMKNTSTNLTVTANTKIDADPTTAVEIGESSEEHPTIITNSLTSTQTLTLVITVKVTDNSKDASGDFAWNFTLDKI